MSKQQNTDLEQAVIEAEFTRFYRSGESQLLELSAFPEKFGLDSLEVLEMVELSLEWNTNWKNSHSNLVLESLAESYESLNYPGGVEAIDYMTDLDRLDFIAEYYSANSEN